ncbi:MAG TPA: prolyl oligopeptidase family serine peptidase [Terriglobia bacterium]|nr:prolyl oligopeptidase family serine peptidase [Terriglobia bacterium]
MSHKTLHPIIAPRRIPFLAAPLVFIALARPLAAADKPPLTLDEFFNSVDISAVRMAPDGHAVVIETRRPDWAHNNFRHDLWLYRDPGPGGASGLVALTQSGHDSDPEWSPNGRWIAFLSDRALPAHMAPASKTESGDEAGSDEPDSSEPEDQVWVISTSGGEAFPLTRGKESVHGFAWSADSRLIYFATRAPWTAQQEEAYKKQWNDVVRFREAERGDVLFSADVASAVERLAAGAGAAPEPQKVASSDWRVKQIAASPDGRHLVFVTDSRTKREEQLAAYNLELVDLPGGAVHLLSHTPSIYESVAWSPDSRRVVFSFASGSLEGSYQDVQGRVYSVDIADTSTPKGAPLAAYQRWGAKFAGSLTSYAVLPDGGLLAAGRLGTEVQPYTAAQVDSALTERPGLRGTYESLSAATHSPRLAFVYSALDRPAEVYLAEGPDQIDKARPITAFNRLFTTRALPEGKPYRWKADDGVTVEGMLIYPPGKFGAERLPMLTLIHGGPEDADGNHFEADWYQWAALAATDGWLVFEPNYRGSVGYGDAFALGIIGPIVSRPGKDILEGVDQLVRDGAADPAHLTVGGYSYGGYMTNWLITQTTRFKAAVTGAGAVEHVANWGNDDTTWDDAYFLGGTPWEAEKNYNAEAAIWQFGKVTTPTHVVGGADDIRVYVGEDYLLERALFTRGIPSSLLIFPGEGHSLSKNPWHGKIKVREELKWLDEYGKR